MKSLTVFTFFLLGLVFGRELPLCLENEEYLECGTACPQSCSDLTSGQLTKCVDMCVSGCFCKNGFVRDGSRCVPASSCNIEKCSNNEVFSECASLCPHICGDDWARLCPEVCVRGCVCQDGYIRSNVDGTCIPQETCNLSGPQEDDAEE